MKKEGFHFAPPPTRETATAAILEEHHIDMDFPDEVRAETLRLPDRVREGDLLGRTDLRDWFTFTIDGAGSKDFDDAVSLVENGDGTVTLGVHIADVGHYVKPGTALDREAFQRGTSVYFADRVAPMLPPELSNELCSLNPGVDRLTLSCVMRVDGDGTVVKYELLRSVIRSKERMTYADCNRLLAGEDEALAERYAQVLPVLRGLVALDAKLKAVRRRRGALDLETVERAILCDERGRPVEVMQKGTGVSEGIIESMMLLANEAVAKHLVAHHLPGVFRVHEEPSQEKVDVLKRMVTPLGYEVRGRDQGSLQKLLRQSRGTPQEGLMNLLVLRTMMKALYSHENEGHYGLAAEYYCHFTSPIRRYPDLMVNRVLTMVLTGTDTPQKRKRLDLACKEAAEQSSQREMEAMTAEREIEKRYLAEYMESHVGEDYVGTVSGVAGFGLFVALPNGVEGLLPARALPDDYYVYLEDQLALVGERTGVKYTFGMELPVRCVGADAFLGQVDFLLLDEEGEVIPPRRRSVQPEHPLFGGDKATDKKVRALLKAKQKKGRYRPPKRGHRGRK